MAAAMTDSMVELQKAADSIREGLKIVNEDIKKLTGRDPAEYRTPANRRVLLKRNFNQQRDLGGPVSKRLSQDGGGRRWGRTVVASRIRPIDTQNDLDSSGEEEAMPQKPAVQSSVVATTKTPNLEPKPKAEDEITQRRNKRMFGLLLGTLKKFKDDDKVRSEKEKKREAIEKKLDEQAQKEKADLASQKKELFQSRRQKQIELRKLEHRMEIAELKTEIEAHNERLKKFIKLKSSPQIYYLPKIHNERTEELLKASEENVEESQKQRFKEMDLSDDEIEPTSEQKGSYLSSIVTDINDVNTESKSKTEETSEDEENKMEEGEKEEGVESNNVSSQVIENGEHHNEGEMSVERESNDEKSADDETSGTNVVVETQATSEDKGTSDQAEAYELLERLG